MSTLEDLKSELAALQERFDNETIGTLTATYLFDLGDAGSWFLKFEEGKGLMTEGAQEGADCTVIVNAENLVKILRKQSNSQMMFMTGKLKVKGKMGLAMKLQKVLG